MPNRGYAFMLRARIEAAEANWDMTQPANRSALRWMKVRYYGWWKWAPIPAAFIGATVGSVIGVGAISALANR